MIEQPRIIEFAAIKVDRSFNELERMSFLCRSYTPLPKEITDITGITDEMLVGKEFFAKHYEQVADFFTGANMMLAHNLKFDKEMLRLELIRCGKLDAFPWPRFERCSVQLSYHIAGYRLNLQKLHEFACGEKFSGAHRAMGDVEATLRCVKWMREKGMF